MVAELKGALPGSSVRTAPGAGEDTAFGGIAERADAVRPGDLYVALRGLSADGHDFVPEALRRGAVALVVERWVEAPVPQVRVDDGRSALARSAVRFYGEPHRRFNLLGITGTNGKTSTAHLVRSVLESAGEKVGILGTVGHGSGSQLEDALLTTPGPVELNRRLLGFAEAGCRSVVMEVSSHAVSQRRVDGIEFDGAVFTNVTRDHLDFHPTFEDYVEAKASFCRRLLDPRRWKSPGTFVYSREDPTVRGVGESFGGDRIDFGWSDEAAVRGRDVRGTRDRTEFTLVTPDWERRVSLGMPGRFNVLNAAAAAAWAWSRDIPADAVVAGLEGLASVPGRFERIGGPRGPSVIVDYAHTPDALERVLEEARALASGRLVAVFGCGGDRDPGKRPLMGEVARRLADRVVVTSDNPRTEDPLRIIGQILEGVDRAGGDAVVEPDRRRAILLAVESAGADDLVVVAGKGHEDYQILGTKKIHFDDREVVREALGLAGKGEA
jgi:UDP-N-acetylmuramoyl-L-alanyl-D-glutamate--2,6-diaminopimelate ligase